jgi:hypothetical protein
MLELCDSDNDDGDYRPHEAPAKTGMLLWSTSPSLVAVCGIPVHSPVAAFRWWLFRERERDTQIERERAREREGERARERGVLSCQNVVRAIVHR